MSTSKPISNPLSTQAPVREMPSLPPQSTSNAVSQTGTKTTIFFLALENFTNRYRLVPFVSESLSVLKNNLVELSSKNATLYHQVRQFIAAMPLDTISASAHPKRLKQVILESLLSPDILTAEIVHTEKTGNKLNTTTDIIRDFQYYSKLNELCTNPMLAREILSIIVERARLLRKEDQENIKLYVKQFSFTHPTDRTFILKQLEGECIIALRSDQIIAPSLITKFPDPPKDYALLSISLFRRFMSQTQQIVARAGETLETIQNRAHTQRKEYEQFITDCKLLTAEDREKMHQLISAAWKKFIVANSTEGEKVTRFLNVLANSN
jgi:hypothetical protein